MYDGTSISLGSQPKHMAALEDGVIVLTVKEVKKNILVFLNDIWRVLRKSSLTTKATEELCNHSSTSMIFRVNALFIDGLQLFKYILTIESY